MAEDIPVERWKLYLHRFLLVFFVMPAVAAAFELPRTTVIRVTAEGLVMALVISGATLWAERSKTGDDDRRLNS
jgi:hypothetical protein